MKYIVILLLTIRFVPAYCVNEPAQVPPAPAPLTLQDQYNNLKGDLEVIDGFRMIKMYTMDKFWVSVMDSLRAQQAKLQETNNTIASQQAEIKALQLTVNKVKNEKESLQAGVESIQVFGNTYSKAGFVTVAIAVTIGLLVLAGVLFSFGRISYFTAREQRKLNETIYQEFEAYKHQAVEKQIKLARELQDYRNRMGSLKTA